MDTISLVVSNYTTDFDIDALKISYMISSASAKLEYIAIYNGKGNVGPPRCLLHVAT